MSTKEDEISPSGPAIPEQFEENLQKVEALTQRLIATLSHKRDIPTALQGPSQELYMRGMAAYWGEMMSNPAKIFEQQVSYWGKSVKHYLEAQQALAHSPFAAPQDDTPQDRRFASEAWRTHPYFNFIKQQYLLNAEAATRAVDELEDLDRVERERLKFFTGQIVDLMSPANFLATNPDALARAVETEGQSLVDGLENLVADLEANRGDMLVSLADKSAFEVGRNIAATPGKVVYRNDLVELIQYEPSTDKVRNTPIVLFPPWINKYYVLDLKPQNSLIKWIVDQGYTLFVVSWKNPDPSYRQVGMSDYVETGYLDTIAQIKEICGVKKVNAIGYCIAGTTLSLALGVMKKRKDTSVNSATLFTTLTDFSNQGEFTVFLTDDFVDGIEAQAQHTGVLESFYMTRTFSFLRARDLVYTPAIKSYMMGETPPAFDLLYWNGDGANLPAKMATEYLRGLCQRNELAGDGFEVAGEKVSLKDVTVPLCAVACVSDHIAAWDSSYRGVAQMGSKDKTFILSGSGHIAGIVNPPVKNKYGFKLNSDLPAEPEDWLEGAEAHDGSWWPTWEEWIRPRSGRLIPARIPGDSSHKVLCEAPGTYVSETPKVT